jgi:hypothetical protein
MCCKHSWKPFRERIFSSSVAFLMTSVAAKEHLPFSVDFNRGNRWKSGEARSGAYGRCSSVVTLFFAKKILDQNRQVCWSIVVKEKPTVGSPILGVFRSDCIPKATKDVSVHLFIHSSNSCQSYHRIPGSFWSYYVCPENVLLNRLNTGTVRLI